MDFSLGEINHRQGLRVPIQQSLEHSSPLIFLTHYHDGIKFGYVAVLNDFFGVSQEDIHIPHRDGQSLFSRSKILGKKNFDPFLN